MEPGRGRRFDDRSGYARCRWRRTDMVTEQCFPQPVRLPGPRLALFGLIIVLVATAVGVAVAPSFHAELRHGTDAQAIRNCLNNNGPEMTFRQRDGSFLLFCQLQDGRLGMQIVDKAKEWPHNWIERTAFIKGDG